MEDKKVLEDQMLFASATTTERAVDEAIKVLLDQIVVQMKEQIPDLALVFLSPHFRLEASEIAARLYQALAPRVLIGCTGEGVIGREAELEAQPAITFVAAHLPGVELKPFSLQSMDWEKTLTNSEEFQQTVGVSGGTPKLFLMVADPFTTPMDAVLDMFNDLYAGIPIMGGMASGSHRAGGNALILNDEVINHGAVGVALSGAVDIDVIVSQGCRPIGQPLSVTSVRENVIMRLDQETPLDHLQTLIRSLPIEDRELLQNGLFVGRAINPDQKTLGRGDFLIRGVVGLDQESGAMVIGDYVEQDETIQFHIRDASTAEEDLEMMLTPQLLYDPPNGGLLFSCNGRGTRLYDHPNGDISTLRKVIGSIDLAGFFCAGEIGPIGGKNFLHGHTASLVLFRPLAGEGE